MNICRVDWGNIQNTIYTIYICDWQLSAIKLFIVKTKKRNSKKLNLNDTNPIYDQTSNIAIYIKIVSHRK